MPEFLIASPDGKQYRVTGPEGSTREDAMSRLQAELARGAAASRTQGAVKPEGGRKAGQRDPSLLSETLGSLAGGVMYGAGEAGSGAMGLSSLQQGGGLPLPEQQDVAAKQQKALGSLPYQHPQTGIGEMARRIGQTLGNPLSWMGPESGLAKLVLGTVSGAGAYLGGQVGGKPGELIGAGLAPVGIAGAMGLAGNMVGRATPERQVDVATLRQEHGIEPRAGDVLGKNWLRRMERGGEGMLGGNSYARTAEKPIEQYTSELAQSFGQNSNRIDNVTVQAAHRDIGDIFDETVDKIPIVITTKEAQRNARDAKGLGADFAKITADMNTGRVSPEVFNKTTGLMDRILFGFETKKDGSSVMGGDKFRELTTYDGPLRRAQREGGDIGHYANQIEASLVEAIERSARRSSVRSEAYEKFKDARRMYANLLAVEKAVGTASQGELGARGLIEPRIMAQVLAAGESGKLKYARGERDLTKLTRDALKVMTPYRPEGSALENLSPWTIPGAAAGTIGLLATGSPMAAAKSAVAGSALGAPILGRMANSPAIQEWLKTQAMSQGNKSLSDILRQAGRGSAAALYQE